MYQVLARKWRPAAFDELVGQEHVARTLRNAIETGRLAHAYIFAGLRGTGKTTVARIFAKCLNCSTGPTPAPCGACDSCREITEGRAIDVLEMDAASRTGIDDIRELQEVVAYAPVRDRYKVLIIDEAHMLTKNALNALLKTLEEPPARVVFVLATTELQKLLPTILSRCQVFEFRRVTPREVAAHLRKVCEAEGILVSDDILERIARAGEGSIRDSLSVLERVIAFGGTTVSESDALYVLGAVRTDVLVAFLRSLAARDAAGLLGVLDGLVGEGHDLLHVWSELLAALRDLMLLAALPGRADLLSRSPEDTASLRDAGAGLSREDLVRAFQLLADLEPGLKASSQPRFLFESALIRLADIGHVRSIESILSDLQRPGASAAGSEAVRPAPRVAPPAPPPQKKNSVDPPAPIRSEPPATPGPATTLLDSAAFLVAFRSLLHESGPMIEVMLDDASSLTFEGGTLRIVFPAAADATRRQVERADQVALLRKIAESVAGAPVVVQVGGGSPPPARPSRPAEPPAAAQPDTSPGPQAEETEPFPRPARDRGFDDQEALMLAAKRDPGVARLLKEFGAQVVEIRPLEAPAAPVEENGSLSGEEST